MRTRSVLMLLVYLLCASTIPGHASDPVRGQYWMSPDRTEVLVAFPQKGEAYYFNNNASELCYTYKIPGYWRPGGQSALLRSEDGRAVAGVLLYSARELAEFEGSDLVTRAAKLLAKVYEQSIGKPLTSVRLVPFPSPRPGTVKWNASWPAAKPGVEMEASKILVEIVPGWIAQITVNGTDDDDGLARHILETLGSISDPECYWPFIRQHFPFVR